MKKDMLKWLKQLMAENDSVERNTIKRKILTSYPKLRFVENDREKEAKAKENLRNSLMAYCKDVNDSTRMHLLDNISSFERQFV